MHLRQLFSWLSEHGLIINPAKCEFGRSSITFLGHHVTPQGAVPLPAKVDTVASFPRPCTVKSLQEFLGMVNLYNRFLPHAAKLMRPLYNALRGRRPADELDWSPGMTDAFGAAKTTLANAALLAHPSPTAPVALTTDASDYAVGAVCEQWVGGAWQPLAFFNRKLCDSERKYSAFDRELLGLFLATRHFWFLLEGWRFTTFVDHKPLMFAMAKSSEPWSGRQQRHLSAISKYTTDIQHVAGKDFHLGLDYAATAADQTADSEVQAYQTAPMALLMEDVVFDTANATLLCHNTFFSCCLAGEFYVADIVIFCSIM